MTGCHKGCIILLLATLAFLNPITASAGQEVGFGYQRVQQNLAFKQDIKFPMDAAFISYSYYHDSGIGLRASLSHSRVTDNSSSGGDYFYQNQIDFMYQVQIAYRYSLTEDIHLLVAYGVTDYHTTWWVDREEPHWSKDTDSGKSITYGFQWDVSSRLSWEMTAGKPYEKVKEGYGKEETYVVTIGLVYKF
jgi:hypothetical protein